MKIKLLRSRQKESRLSVSLITIRIAVAPQLPPSLPFICYDSDVIYRVAGAVN